MALAIVAVLGAGASLLVAWKRSADGAALRVQLGADVDKGGLISLGRAQALGRRLYVADKDDHDAAAALAYTSAVLAVDYGFQTAAEAQAVLAQMRAGDGQAGEGTDDPERVLGMAAAARALCQLHAGDREGAARVAAVGVAASPGLPHPLYALGRARARPATWLPPVGLSRPRTGASRTLPRRGSPGPKPAWISATPRARAQPWLQRWRLRRAIRALCCCSTKRSRRWASPTGT